MGDFTLGAQITCVPTIGIPPPELTYNNPNDHYHMKKTL